MQRKDIYNNSKPLENTLNQILYSYIGKGVPLSLPDDARTFINEGYAGNVNVYPIIRKIVNPALGVKWCVKDRSTEEEATDQTLMLLLDKPNPMQGKYEFIDEALTWRLITGNRYIYWIAPLNGPNRGKPAEMHLLPASEVEIIGGEWLQPVKAYHLTIGNTYKEIPAEQVIHGKMTQLKYGVNGQQLYGMSPLQAALKVMTSTNLGYDRLKLNFENGGPDYIITNTKDSMDSTEYTEEQRRSIWEWLKGSKWRKERFHIKNKPVEVHQLGQSIVDLNVLEYLKLSLRDYCNIYGVPSALMNDNEYATQSANAREYQRQLWNNAIIPELEMLKEDLNKVASVYNKATGQDLCFEYDLSDIPELQNDIATQAQGLSSAWWLTVNEHRQAMGLPELEMDGDLLFMPMGLAPMQDITAPQDITDVNKYLDTNKIKY